MGRVEELIRSICRDKGTYDYVDIMRALDARRETRPRGRYAASWPAEREVIWLIAHAEWSCKIGEDGNGRSVYRYEDADARR